MNGFFLHTGNRLEDLAGALAQLLSQPGEGGSPFAPERILVQSLGMQRWLSLQLAARLGIAMNCEFPFPQGFIDGQLDQWVPAAPTADSPAAPAPARDALARDRLAWQIFHALPPLLSRREFTPVAGFLRDNDPLKRFQLSQRLAHLFDQYLLYRPEMILAWEREESVFPPADSPDEAWQAALWRTVSIGARHHFAAALERLREVTLPPGPRLAVFGISSLPPAQMEILFHLAASRPVHFFLLAPSQEYFGDDLTPRQRARRGIAEPTGNPLLTSLGQLHAHFVELILEVDERMHHPLQESDGLYRVPEGDTLLAQLQRDLFTARNPFEPPEAETPQSASQSAYRADGSLELHICHSPMREVEVLYDQLLARLEADPTLSPRDLLVMAPDIEAYAPYIHAVFGNPEDPALRLPYTVADRHPRLESHAVDLFLRLLDLVGSRCEASTLFSLLENDLLCQRFGFSSGDLAQIRTWIVESGIRWGFSAEHRAALDLPPVEATTWRAGLDRLLLGMALRGHNTRLYEGILPVDDIDSSSTALLGRFAEAISLLEHTTRELSAPRPLREWPGLLLQTLDRFFTAAEEDEKEESPALRRMREAIARLATIAESIPSTENTESTESIPFEIIKAAFTDVMTEQEQQGRFLAGGVTFCALKPMRSIPARGIWLLGMDEGVFPRKAIPTPFDLMARRWRLGDRSQRGDDRYLFLETLISARDFLGISTVGRSIRTNEAIPPSIVVSELLDQLTLASGDDTLVPALTVAHPLQAFSPRYFSGDPHLFTYSQANAVRSSGSSHSERRPSEPLTRLRLPEPEDPAERHIALGTLISYLCAPARFFLQQRLGIAFPYEDDALSDMEPIAPDALAHYQLRLDQFNARLTGKPHGDAGLYALRGLLPSGGIGEALMEGIDAEAEAFWQRVSTLLTAPLPPQDRTLSLDGFVLHGRLIHLNGTGAPHVLHCRPARLKLKDRISTWIEHLFHIATAPSAGEAGRTGGAITIGLDRTLRYHTPDSAAATALLQTLADIYWQGQQEALPLYPETSFAYAKAAESGKDPVAEARKVWIGSAYANGESTTDAHRLLHPEGTLPWEEEPHQFEELAQTVYGPLHHAIEAEEPV